MNWFYNGCILLVLSTYTCVLADPEICYDCSGIECNDPFNIVNAKVMNCSTPTTYRTAEKNIDLQLEEKLFPRLYGYRATTTNEYVCVTYIYENNSDQHNATVRRCVPKTIDNASVCETIKKSVSALLGKVQRCSTCDSDLCNSAVSLMQPFVISLLLICFLKILE